MISDVGANESKSICMYVYVYIYILFNIYVFEKCVNDTVD